MCGGGGRHGHEHDETPRDTPEYIRPGITADGLSKFVGVGAEPNGQGRYDQQMSVDLASATTLQLLEALEEGLVSSVELFEQMLANIERMNPAVNAVVAQDIDRARAEASAADDRRAAGEKRGPLAGLPMTVKDAYETLDLVTTGGAPELADHRPERDADVVRLLRRAGAVVWAKTNVPLYSGDHQTYNEVYGLTRNPWDLERTVGGSSGGAAAAVACGFTTAEVGSDIGNSIRQPASNNGIFGLKTTHGLISGRGHIPGPPGTRRLTDLGVFGPLGRSCGDLRLLLEVLTNSSTAFAGAPGASLPRNERQPDVERLRIGVWSDDAVSPVDDAVKRPIEAAAVALADAGAQVDAEIRPSVSSALLHDTYMHLLNAALSAGFPDEFFDRMTLKASGSTAVSGNHEVDFARQVTMSHRDWIGHDEARTRAQVAWAEVFKEVDVVLAPIQPVPPFPHDIERNYGQRTLSVNGSEVPYRNILFWAGIATLPLLPSLAIPLGQTDAGLPVGMQLIAPKWSDHKLLGYGEEIASVLGVHFQPPPLVAAS